MLTALRVRDCLVTFATGRSIVGHGDVLLPA
ncbi:hypothetical protein Rrhod_1453 [Rhodococcus rhodnii LMG 5362]|uniref:Uncharacterized protein n=1 Tax=Rhodococcus rhodnii LMG 5362 TaxID=1273125 RepID=R7WPK0_9NOCA|nr:hypothetical protein Rrhod_1453 [Rhodococcus rhodnii LMG 5362]